MSLVVKNLKIRLRSISLFALSVLFLFSLLPSPVRADNDTELCPAGMSRTDCAALIGGWADWVPNDSLPCGPGSELIGTDNIQKGFNYFLNKYLTKVQSAAIIGNFMQESGMNPEADQPKGPGMGIAQWSEGDRWDILLKFAEQEGRDPFDLGLQLDFVWAELNHTDPARDYTKALEALKSADGIEQAVIKFEKIYEAAGNPQMDNRIAYAKQVLDQYGSVSGSGATACSSGTVNCELDTPGSGEINETRQHVVCGAEAEYKLWESGQMDRGTDFFKYSEDHNELWCADFVSWIYNQAGYPLSSPWRVPIVSGIRKIGEAEESFHWHLAGSYTPVPGDIVVYQDGISHVNIVVSVNATEKSMEVIGGDENLLRRGDPTSSIVQKSKYSGFTGHHITGYVSPD